MRLLVYLALVFSVIGSASAKTAAPLTLKEISLMLRSGYSSDAVLREITARRLVEVCDPSTEKLLAQAGASASLLAAVKDQASVVSAQEGAQAKDLLATQNRARLQQAEVSRKLESDYQAGLRTAATANAATVHALYSQVKDSLVRCTEGTMALADDRPLAGKKFYALYFSAHWCPPCRKFTPELVDFYNRVAPKHPEFELIFVSSDRSLAGMETYMRETKMPWPAVDFQKIGSIPGLRKFAGNGIPCLVVIDASGKVVADSFDGERYLGPAKALADMDAILTGAPAVAASR